MHPQATLTPAEAQAKIEKYKREAENAVLDKVMTKREKVDGEVRGAHLRQRSAPV